MKLKRYDIEYKSSVTSWDEALPLGNGRMGCLLYGDGPIRLAVDRVDLWDTRSNPTTREEGFHFKNLVKLSSSGKKEDWEERTRLFENIFSGLPYPSKITAGRLELDFGVKTNNVRSRVDVKRAVATIDIENGFGKIDAFLSATKYVGVARVYGQYTLNIHIPDYISGDENGNCGNNSGIGEKDRDYCLRYPRTKVVRDGEYVYYRQKTHTDFEYGVIVLRKDYGTYSELYFTIATNVDARDFIAAAKTGLSEAATIGFAVLKRDHVAWWKKYWAKSQISIEEPLLEKVYYRSWYLFASCSRKGFLPMPLQGVWTADNDSLPPWKGDYHHDTNTQLSYQAYLKANRLSEGEVFIDYLWSLKSAFEKFAKEFFGVDGLLLPSCSTLDGKAMGGWAHYSLSPTMTIWAAQSFDEYYLYTGDEAFLRERAYPFFKGVGNAIYGLLEEREGKLYLPLSSSPEIYDATPQAYLKPNSNFDLALMRYLYKTLIGYAEALGEKEESEKYVGILNKLDDISISKDGGVMLDSTQKLQESHRHFSHLMCLYPLHLINFDTEEHTQIYENTLRDIEFYGTGMWVGFSFAMCAQIYAMAYKGNSAYEKLRQFANGFVAENGFHLNGDFKNYGYTTFHYRPFTLESSFGFCDALQEMLLQEHQGYIHLFPAIPDDWVERELSFENLRSYGGLLISAVKKGGTISMSVRAPKTTLIRVKNVFGVVQVCVESKNRSWIAKEKDDMFEIKIKRGTTVIKPC